MPVLRTELMEVSMGPQHPATHGVLQLLLTTDGEEVVHAKPVIGYLHRCKEKIGQMLPYAQFTPYTDRMDYLAAMNNNWAYAIAVERLAQIEVPERAEYIRVIFGELNRIASHLVAVGTYGLDLGTFTPFLYSFTEREYILDLFELVCGARLTYNYIRIGGVAKDLTPGWEKKCEEFLDRFEPKLTRIDELMGMNFIFMKRTGNVGVLPLDLALAYGITGPMLRASGGNWDLRRDVPYSLYPKFQFNIPIGTGMAGTVGDCFDRYWVRIQEMIECCKIIRQALAGLQEGPVMAKVPKILRPKPGEIYFRMENPRGELGFYVVSDGTPVPYRIKVRGPSFCNLSVIEAMVDHMLVADLAATLGSFDVVMGEVDR